jgi:hypothetical protein
MLVCMLTSTFLLVAIYRYGNVSFLNKLINVYLFMLMVCVNDF